MTRSKDQKPRVLDLTPGQAISLDRAQIHYAHLLDRYSQPIKEVQEAETDIQTALNAILSSNKAEPSKVGWQLVIDGDSARLEEGKPE